MIAAGLGLAAGMGAAIVALATWRRRRRQVRTLVWDPASRAWVEARARKVRGRTRGARECMPAPGAGTRR